MTTRQNIKQELEKKDYIYKCGIGKLPEDMWNLDMQLTKKGKSTKSKGNLRIYKATIKDMEVTNLLSAVPLNMRMIVPK